MHTPGPWRTGKTNDALKEIVSKVDERSLIWDIAAPAIRKAEGQP